MTPDPPPSARTAQKESLWRRMVQFGQRAQWLGVVLLVATLTLIWLLNRVFGLDRLFAR